MAAALPHEVYSRYMSLDTVSAPCSLVRLAVLFART